MKKSVYAGKLWHMFPLVFLKYHLNIWKRINENQTLGFDKHHKNDRRIFVHDYRDFLQLGFPFAVHEEFQPSNIEST